MNTTGVLITGGGGFIGSHLAEFYLNKNIPVICVDNFCTGLRSNATLLKNKFSSTLFHFIETDVTLPWSWADDVVNQTKIKLSHVFHFASPASPPHYQNLAFETLDVNSVGLRNALNFADKYSARVVFASTSEVYGDPTVSPQPESYFGNVNSFGYRSCYDESKRFGEALLFTHNWKKKTQHGLVRIFNTYGPRMNPNDGRVVINFLVQASRGEALTVYGTGQQTRSFCFISDLVAGINAYAETQIVEPVNLGNDTEFTINELVEEVKKLYAHKNLSLKYLDLPHDDPTRRRPDLTKARKLLSPWRPTVSLAQGLIEMKNWVEA